MIQYYLKQDGQLTELDRRTPGCWINVSPPFSSEEITGISNELAIPMDFLTDSLDLDERSRFERENDIRLIVINTPLQNELLREDVNALYITVPIGIILTPDHILTITSHSNPILERFLENRVKNFNPTDVSQFVLQIFEHTVLRFLACLKQLNLKRNHIERDLYDSNDNKELKQLLTIEKSFVYFVDSLSANELLKLKMKRVDYLNINKDAALTDLFEDIIIDNSQALEMSKVYTEILNGTMDSYSSIVSNNLNQVIQRLTLITIVLMLPTLVASFYGMNVEGLPLKDRPYAFAVILGFSILISMLLVAYFRRKRMF